MAPAKVVLSAPRTFSIVTGPLIVLPVTVVAVEVAGCRIGHDDAVRLEVPKEVNVPAELRAVTFPLSNSLRSIESKMGVLAFRPAFFTACFSDLTVSRKVE